MIPRVLAAALGLAGLVIAPHILAVLADVIRAAVTLGPHSLVMIAFTLTLAVTLLLLWRIDVLTMSTGWRVIPVRRAAGAR